MTLESPLYISIDCTQILSVIYLALTCAYYNVYMIIDFIVPFNMLSSPEL